jgi:hypothetical protein
VGYVVINRLKQKLSETEAKSISRQSKLRGLLRFEVVIRFKRAKIKGNNKNKAKKRSETNKKSPSSKTTLTGNSSSKVWVATLGWKANG